MARRPRPRPARPRRADEAPPSPTKEAGDVSSPPGGFWTTYRTWLAVILLLTIHLTLAVRSLVRENPTVDEVAHLPAGVTYWQKRTFRLYHHNPPLIKLVAALPVVLSHPDTSRLYEANSWTDESPSYPTFSQNFASLNRARYFELFARARLVLPLFSALGGLVVFAWSRRLYGTGGGLLSLALWTLCPNVLAHCRLITTDVGATALGFAATYLFWRYTREPRWSWAVAAGMALGLAQLSKFSMILLYGLWPLIWAVRLVLTAPPRSWPKGALRALPHALAVVALSIATVDAGYLFEGVGTPLGRFEFISASLTKPVPRGVLRPKSNDPLVNLARQHRINRFRGTLLGALPSPLPSHYLLGFDEQKLESEGLPAEWLGEAPGPGGKGKAVRGYAVYLDGVLRRTGWWYYYFLTLAYKVPEGTWCLVALSMAVLVGTRRTREAWADEIAVGIVPFTVLLTMSFLTDINLGLRYVLPIAPYVFIATGKVVPWASGLRGRPRRFSAGFVGLSLAGTAAAALWIHPHYLAYFNWASGGPDREPPHLIDSNLDWGQDLVNLRDWVRQNAPDRSIGLAYFGQINPNIFQATAQGFDWFLPPPLPGTMVPLDGAPTDLLAGPARRLTPGLYAVSATLVYGLPWRLYDPSPAAWSPWWNAREPHAFGYFRRLRPFRRIGHSIYLYEVTPEDVRRLANLWDGDVREGRAD